MNATVLLADSAQAVGNKLYILGGGWTLTGPTPSPSAVAVSMSIPRDRGVGPFIVAVELFDSENDAPVQVEGNAVRVEAEMRVGEVAPGAHPDSPYSAVFAFNFAPIPLAGGRLYSWRLTVDGESRDDWRADFATRPAEQGAAEAAA